MIIHSDSMRRVRRVRRETEQSAEVHWPPPLVVPDILEETVEVPDAFKCPITLTYMREPATTHEGTLLVGTGCAYAEHVSWCSSAPPFQLICQTSECLTFLCTWIAYCELFLCIKLFPCQCLLLRTGVHCSQDAGNFLLCLSIAAV